MGAKFVSVDPSLYVSFPVATLALFVGLAVVLIYINAKR